MPYKSHDEYFAAHPAEIRLRLESIQNEVEAQVPGAIRTISYNMPAFRNEKTFFYFAAFKNHIGVYPPVKSAALVAETEALRGPKGNLSFPHGRELPLGLIGRVAASLAAQYSAR